MALYRVRDVGCHAQSWDPERTPGGSSGGSAAAVAAGMVPVALGADGAGSIRIPAACCGLFGLKPSRDRVPRTPHDRDGSHWIVFGALTRSVRDAAVMLDVLGDDGQGFAQAAQTRPERLQIAVAPRLPARDARPSQRQRARRARRDGGAAALARTHGPRGQGRPPRPRDVPVIVGLILRGVRDLVAPAERPRRLERRTRAFARPGALSVRAHNRAPAERRARDRCSPHGGVRRSRSAAHPRAVSPGRAGRHHGRPRRRRHLPLGLGWVPLTILWNITGQPAASVPAGFSADGLPLAVQIVGRPGDERTVLGLAAELEAERPWTDRRPPLA